MTEKLKKKWQTERFSKKFESIGLNRHEKDLSKNSRPAIPPLLKKSTKYLVREY